jgi:hypothetical protein
MDVYTQVRQIHFDSASSNRLQAIAGSSNHDLFYTNANIIAAYKNYISVTPNLPAE